VISRHSIFVVYELLSWLLDVPVHVISIGSIGGRAISEAGKRTSLPSIAMFGVTAVTLCTVMRYAAITVGNLCGQFSGCSSAVHLNICNNVQFIRSVCPSDCGWNDVVLVFTTPVN